MAKNKRDGGDTFAGLFGLAEEFTPVNDSGNPNKQPASTDEREVIEPALEAGEVNVDTLTGSDSDAGNGEGDIIITYDENLVPYEERTKAGIVSAKEKRETRSKTIQIKLPPSLFAEAKGRCDDIGISFNEGVNQLLKFWLYSQR